MQEPQYFNDVADIQPGDLTGKVAGSPYLDNLMSMQIGAGTKLFRADHNGIWLGAAQFADAPFRVDMQGNVYITSALGSLVFDAVNNQILIFEGDVAVGFFGIQANGF